MVTRAEIDDAKKSEWDKGNQVLYEMCEKYPGHTDAGEIVAKIWLIGRSYAAAIERRKPGPDDISGDDFYFKRVAPKIIKANLDDTLAPLKPMTMVNDANIDIILEMHNEVMTLFQHISNMNKRSLASKYLHFHYRDLFFIYDSRASAAITKLASRLNVKSFRLPAVGDADYRRFCAKCLAVRDRIKQEHGLLLTPRELDNLLLGY